MYKRRKRSRKPKGRREVALLLLSIAAVAAAMAWTVPATGGSKDQAVQMQGIIPAHEATGIPDITAMGAQITATQTPTPEPTQEETESKKTYIGKFTVTAYCSCEICCGEWANNRPNGIVYTASGEEAKDGVTVGASWDVLPAGTKIEIEGLGERIIQDRPADWIIEKYDGMILDVYFGSHEAALEYGKHTADVWIIEDGKEE